ncbi:MAG: hypothetical protein L0Y57_05805 [Beijerinckiaceae bacterium]|nr:hypothetical protein [Beijerinckiaceae bacterium]
MFSKKARARLRVTRDLTLIGLSGAELARIGATAEIVHGGLPYGAPQTWPKALHDHPQKRMGLPTPHATTMGPYATRFSAARRVASR